MINNGVSIYNFGGGGGGYKDGGQLVDGDFIYVKNNTVSYYDNVSRDPVNFYFDVKQGEIINSVIEFNTQVNSTVNIYVVNSYGELVPIGNIGGNNVTAGESYKITVIDNSFIIENVVAPITPDEPAAIIIDGKMYGCKKAGNRIWATENLAIETPNSIPNHFGLPGNRMYPKSELSLISSLLTGGWRIPDGVDWADLRDNSGYTIQQLQSVGGWDNPNYAGNNQSGLNFYPFGYRQTDSIYSWYKEHEWSANWVYNDANRLFVIGYLNNNRIKQFNSGYDSQWAPIRICKTA